MINYINGDLFDQPKLSGNIIIPHIVNNIGAWGSGFVIPLGEAHPIAKEAYLNDYRAYKNAKLPMLGVCRVVNCDHGIYVANMCAQTGIMSHSTGDRLSVNHKPIRYAALIKCMQKVAGAAHYLDASIVAPKFGSDRAGGTWEFIEELIEEIWCNVKVTICSL